MSEIDPLSSLALKFGSDKWGSHSYTAHYEKYFAPLRDKKINIFEIGVGGYDDPSKGGLSLKMWSAYFPLANIFALDYFEKSSHQTDRIKIYQGSQADEVLLRQINQEAGGFDIIIDDGSHICEHVITSFNTLFPLLNAGGLYVVEDTQTSYWPKLGGSSVDPDSQSTTMGFFKGLIHGLNHVEFINNELEATYYEKNILFLHFYHNLIFIQKGDNSEPSNVASDNPMRSSYV